MTASEKGRHCFTERDWKKVSLCGAEREVKKRADEKSELLSSEMAQSWVLSTPTQIADVSILHQECGWGCRIQLRARGSSSHQVLLFFVFPFLSFNPHSFIPPFSYISSLFLFTSNQGPSSRNVLALRTNTSICTLLMFCPPMYSFLFELWISSHKHHHMLLLYVSSQARNPVKIRNMQRTPCISHLLPLLHSLFVVAVFSLSTFIPSRLSAHICRALRQADMHSRLSILHIDTVPSCALFGGFTGVFLMSLLCEYKTHSKCIKYWTLPCKSWSKRFMSPTFKH